MREKITFHVSGFTLHAPPSTLHPPRFTSHGKIMHVIGTAGHVDHGKSTLIEALTGTHPDRLREEREREMTIVLGFAWLTLPNGEEVGIIDVPGHRDFIENMLSGIGAIDAALFVVAADEGVMPQTREHLAILDILQIQGGVIALTKTDLVDDPEWLDMVEADLWDTLSGTVLDSAPLVRVSARTGDGIPELLRLLGDTLADRPPRPDLGRPRLPADRVFTMSGFGTVVTGTLTDGHIEVGDEVLILPRGLRGRIRGLQTHKREEQIAVPGSRTAINISGIDVAQIQRGDVVARPGDYKPTRRLDLHFRLLPDVSQPVKHDMEVKLFIGASEVISRLRLLGTDALEPGESGWLQLELTRSVVAVRGDRYISRRPSPGETLGGGVVVDPQPKGRHKRFDQSVLDSLEALVGGSPADVLLQAMLAMGIAPIRDVVARSSLGAEAAQALDELLQGGQALALGDDSAGRKPDTLITSSAYWAQFADRTAHEINAYHQIYPLRKGIPREELKSRLKVSARIFGAALSKLVVDGVFAEASMRQNLPGASAVPLVFQPEHEISFSPAQQKAADRLLTKFAASPYAPPTIKDCVTEAGDDVYNALLDLERLVPVSSEVAFRREDYESMVAQVRGILERDATISVSQMRDHFKTSRRYVLAFLEHLDAIGVTVRAGDVRKLKA
ncbi:MAG: selenocysteine-specific translation elongation factor [Chloroflexota bacterium]